MQETNYHELDQYKKNSKLHQKESR